MPVAGRGCAWCQVPNPAAMLTFANPPPVLFLARPTADGEACFLRNSSWLVVFPVIPLLFLTIGIAMLIKAAF